MSMLRHWLSNEWWGGGGGGQLTTLLSDSVKVCINVKGVEDVLANFSKWHKNLESDFKLSPPPPISNFYPILWLRNNCDVINTRNILFLETDKINQFMQFSIDIYTAKLLFIQLVLAQYGCLWVYLPFHCNIRQVVCHFNFLVRKFL